MRGLVWIYAGCMLVTGSINTISTKYQDLTVEHVKHDGTPIYFQHPAFQSAMMFTGEAFCLVPYFILRCRRRTIKAQLGILNNKPPMPPIFVLKRVMAFAIPTLCDATATTLLNIGLFYTFASTYQMLRGTLVLFAGCLTVLLLRRRLYLHHWLGMVLIAAGAAIVGLASIAQSTHEPPHHHHHPPPMAAIPALDIQLDETQHLEEAQQQALLQGGDVSPQAPLASMGRSLLDSHWLFQGLHSVYKGGSSSGGGDQDDSHGAWAGFDSWVGSSSSGSGGGDSRGLEAGAPVLPLFGDALVILAQLFAATQFVLEEKFLAKYSMQPLLAVGIEGAWGVVLSLCALPLLAHFKAPNGLPMEDAHAAFDALARLPDLRSAVILSVVSIGMFNWFGLMVTKAISGASRATIDACRTLLVWVFSLTAGWETFHSLQVLGFIVLISGTSLYNELLRSCLPSPPPHDDLERGESYDDDDVTERQLPEIQGGGMPPRGAASVGSGAASAGLHEPLLPQAQQQRQGNGGRWAARAQAICSPTAPPKYHKTNFLARSIRLGGSALSPHSLGEEMEESSSQEGEGIGPYSQGHLRHQQRQHRHHGAGSRRREVLRPMDLASTPLPTTPIMQQYDRSSQAADMHLHHPHQHAQLAARTATVAKGSEVEGARLGQQGLSGSESGSESDSERSSSSSEGVGAGQGRMQP